MTIIGHGSHHVSLRNCPLALQPLRPSLQETLPLATCHLPLATCHLPPAPLSTLPPAPQFATSASSSSWRACRVESIRGAKTSTRHVPDEHKRQDVRRRTGRAQDEHRGTQENTCVARRCFISSPDAMLGYASCCPHAMCKYRDPHKWIPTHT
jgi:hypothetical protein